MKRTPEHFTEISYNRYLAENYSSDMRDIIEKLCQSYLEWVTSLPTINK